VVAKQSHYGAEVSVAGLEKAETVRTGPSYGHFVGANLPTAEVLQPYPGDEAKTTLFGILIGKAVLYKVESRTLLSNYNVVTQPAFHSEGSPGVSVILRGILGVFLSELKSDHIVWALVMIRKLFLRGDHIIRRANQSGEVTKLFEIVANALEWLHIGQAVAPLLIEYNKEDI